MTQHALSEILALFEASYRIKFRPSEAKAWSLLLAPVNDEDGKRAAVELCRSSPFVPKPADIFRLIDEYREAHRYPPPPRLPEPSDPAVARRGLELIRETLKRVRIGNPEPSEAQHGDAAADGTDATAPERGSTS